METQVKYSYQHSGSKDKPTILFLHGFMGRGSDWTAIAKSMRPDFATLTIDLPGHGDTEANSREAYRMQNCSKDLIALLDRLKLKQVHLVGYSMGGRFALYLLVNYPDRFLASVIESATPGLATQEECDARKDSDRELAAKIKRVGLMQFLPDWFKSPLFGNLAEDEKLLAELIEKRLKNRPKRLGYSLTQMGTGCQPDLSPELPKIDKPLLFIAGELDQKYQELNQQMSDLCPNSQTVIIEKTGHNCHYQKPDEFVTQVRNFLLNK